MMKFDDILVYLGDFGPYQRRQYVLMNLTSICIAFITMSPVFILYVPDHRCAIPGYPNDTYAIQGRHHAQLVKKWIPLSGQGGSDRYTQCTLLQQGAAGRKSRPDVRCNRWVYDKTDMKSTIATDLNLVCENKRYRAHANMAMMVGKLFGATLQGVLSDSFGRKKTFCIGVVMMIAGSFINVFINSIRTLIAFRFIVGMTTTSTFMSAFVLGTEFVGPSKRGLAGIGIQFFWQIGLYLLLFIVSFFREWRCIMLSLAVPTIFYLPICFFVRESPRWLLSVGRKQEAENIIQEVAQYNQVVISEKDLKELKDIKEEKNEKENLWKLFSSLSLGCRCLFVFINWAICSMIYYGLALNVSNMDGNIYTNFFWSATLEGAGNLVCYLLLDYAGRRRLYLLSLSVAGLGCALPVLMNVGFGGTVLTVMSSIGRMGITSSYSTLYIYTAEMFPTVLRNSVLGACSLTARFGGIAAPYIADAGLYLGPEYEAGFPMIVFAGCAVLACCLAVTFPETLNRNLPDTIEEAKNFGRNLNKSKYQL